MTTSVIGSAACCPLTLGEVCWNNGTTVGRAFAVYDPVDETTKFIDAITGNEVPSANIVACQSDAEVAQAVATIAHIRATANGTVAAGKESVVFTNVGTTAATVAGAAVDPGQSVGFQAYYDPVARQFRRLPAIAYTASATAILSIATVD